MQTFSRRNFKQLCTQLAQTDKDLEAILSVYGYPPFWTRPNTFATLVLTILEQQVSLASAFAAYTKLKEKVGVVSPERILLLSDEELRSCYFSRQKMVYVRELATALTTKQISLRRFAQQPDETVRQELKKLKGMGDWTVDIYLLHALKRADIFPLGDLALVKAVKEVKALPLHTTREELLALSFPWKPYRSIATMIFWHHYLQKRRVRTLL